MRRIPLIHIKFVPVLGILAVGLCAAAFAEYPYARETETPTPLDRYVAKPDPNYHWELARTEEEEGLTSFTLALTSQQWRTKAEVNRPLWKHWVTVSIPEQVDYPTAMMFIGGGSNRSKNPRTAERDMKRLARQTHSVAAAVYMIPNQPLVFPDLGGFERSEDGMIAYTWYKFFQTGDEEWPARLPMTKAVVRAMDTVQEFCASETGGGHRVEDFVVAGGSKRGWTTWTTAIVDTRVKAIVPCVIDLVHVIPSFRHHYSVLGFWSAAIMDYRALRILDWLETPENLALMHIVDPYYYLDRLTMPKFIMNGGNDQFFLPDSSSLYWDDLEAPKWLRTIPNAGHGLDREEAYNSLAAFHHAIAADMPIPKYAFTCDEKNGTVEARLLPAANGEVIEPAAVKLWQAHNPEARDFRGGKARYVDTPVEAAEPGVYRATVAEPDTGWTCYFLELTFPGPAPETPFTFTTGPRVIPVATPYKYTPKDPAPNGFITREAQ